MFSSVKYPIMMWTPRKSWGPDVEMLVYVPMVIAIESKPSPSVARKEIGQVMAYVESKQYDAVLIRVENAPKNLENQDWRMLKSFSEREGIGLIVGGDTYRPLGEGEKVILPATVRLNANPIEFFHKRKTSLKIVTKTTNIIDSISELSEFRKYLQIQIARRERL